MNISGTLLLCCALMHPFIWKNTYSTFCDATWTRIFPFLLLTFPFCLFPSTYWVWVSSYLVSQISRVWLLLPQGMGDQLNIYGSTFIQMFGNGESLWPENWHDLFVHNMQQGTWRASLQHVSPWMCFVVAVLADDVIVMDIFVGCGLSESYWYYPIDQKRGILPGAPPKKKIHNRHQNFRSKQITIEIRQCKAHLQIARLPI